MVSGRDAPPTAAVPTVTIGSLGVRCDIIGREDIIVHVGGVIKTKRLKGVEQRSHAQFEGFVNQKMAGVDPGGSGIAVGICLFQGEV